MSNKKTTINVNVKGINDFVSELQRAEVEINKIKSDLSKIHVGMSASEIDNMARLYHAKMYNVDNELSKHEVSNDKKVFQQISKLDKKRHESNLKDIKKENKERKSLSSKSSSSFGKISRSIGMTAGLVSAFAGAAIGGVGELIGATMDGLGNLIEEGKSTNKTYAKLSDSFSRVSNAMQVMGTKFLNYIGGPLSSIINGFIKLIDSATGIDLSQGPKLSDNLIDDKAILQSKFDALKNLSGDSRKIAIEAINKEYGKYLENQLTDEMNQTEINALRDKGLSNINKRIQANLHEEQTNKLLQKRKDLLRSIEEEEAKRAKGVKFDTDLLNERNGIPQNAKYGSRVFYEVSIKEDALKELETIDKQLRESVKHSSVLLNGKYEAEFTLEPTDEPTEEIMTSLVEGESSLKVFVDLVLNNNTKIAIDEIETDYNVNIKDNNFKAAQANIDEMVDALDVLDDKLKSINDNNKTYDEATRDLVRAESDLLKLETAKAEGSYNVITNLIKDINNGSGGVSEKIYTSAIIDDISDSEIRDIIKERIAPYTKGALTRVFITDGLSNLEADVILDKVASKYQNITDESKRAISIIRELNKNGIEFTLVDAFVPVIKDAELQVSNLKNIQKQIKSNNDKAGADILKERETINNKILKQQEELDKKQLEQSIKSLNVRSKILKDNSDLRIKLGIGDAFDEYYALEDKFDASNNVLIEDLKREVKEFNKIYGEGFAEISGVFEDGTASLRASESELDEAGNLSFSIISEKFKNILLEIENQKVELSKVERAFADEALKAFNESFESEKELLNNSLTEKNQIIRDKEDELTRQRKIFNNRAKKDKRDYNDEEVEVVSKHTDELVKLVNEKYDLIQEIETTNTLKALSDIEQQGGDIDALYKKFTLIYSENEYKRAKDMAIARDRGTIDFSKDEELFKDKEYKEAYIGISKDVLNSFTTLYGKFIEYQDLMSQRMLDGMRNSISQVDSELSSTTDRLLSLSSELDLTREGRRDAVLRSIDIEKDREQSLLDKKIKLQKELELEESKQNKRRKEQAIALALINGATAVVGTLAGYASLGPLGVVPAALQTATIIATTAAEVAVIESQQFQHGGLLEGPSHLNGGIPFTIDGVNGFEAEGGEVIINKRATAMYLPLLSRINQLGGGVSLDGSSVSNSSIYEDGGNVGNNSETVSYKQLKETIDSIAISNNALAESINMIKNEINKPTYVSVTDIEDIQNQVKVLAERSSF